MTTKTSKVTIHMVASLDGFIAKKDGSVSWMHSTDNYEKGVTLSEEDIAAFLKEIDCYVMGARTYEKALELGWPYGEVPVKVITHRDLPVKNGNVEFYAGDLTKLVNDQLKSTYKNIWMVGGSSLTKAFLQLRLADEIILSIMPIILGEGTLFFDCIGQEERLHLKEVTAYKDGMVELWYEIKVLEN